MGKRTVALSIVILVLVLAVLAFVLMQPKQTGLASLPATEKQEVKIGVVMPFTGSQAQYGVGTKDGLELAVKEINQDPEFQYNINLVFEDNAGDIKNSVSAAQKLISVDNVLMLISGPSQHALAVAPIAEQNKIVLLTMGSQAKELKIAGDFVFKNDDDLATLGGVAAQKMKDWGYKKAAILFAQYNDATVDSKAAFEKKFAELGGEVVYSEGFAKDTADFHTSLAKIKQAKPDAVFLTVLTNDTVPIIKQMKELELSVPIVSNGAIEDKAVIEGVGSLADGIVFLTFQGFPSEEFVQKSQKAFGYPPRRWSLEAYDGMKIVAIALSKIPADSINSSKLQEQMAKIKSFDGESGHIEFDGQGNAKRQIFVKTVKNGEFVKYE